MLIDCGNALTGTVIGAAIRVHRELGAGLLESVYQKALIIELECLKVPVESQKEVPVHYRGQKLGLGFRLDLLVDQRLVVELKAVKKLEQVHIAQMLTYMRLLSVKRGLLINFNVPRLADGIKRLSL